jgi:dsDNA-binding SOS-regulon protein
MLKIIESRLLILVLTLSLIDFGSSQDQFEFGLTKKLNKRELNVEEEGNTFDNQADITVDLEDKNSIHQLEAFKSSSNSRFIKENITSRLQWFSIGIPNLLVRTDRKTKNLSAISYDSTGFYILIEMLTKEQRQHFVNKIYRKYQIKVDEDQISNLIPQKFECSLSFQCKNEKVKFENFIGTVKNLREWPYKCVFQVDKNQKECLKQAYEESELKFECNLSTTSKKPKQNILEIDAKKLSNFGMLFFFFFL